MIHAIARSRLTTWKGHDMNTSEIETAGAACDPAAIAALREEGDDLLAELIDIFMAETPRQMAQLERALATGDSSTATRVAHTLKGTAGVFGAFVMEALAAHMEHAARRGSIAKTAAICPQLRAEIDRVTAALARCHPGLACAVTKPGIPLRDC
jgi:HPt (histidine-containing phosphotransfer) domain-containing protein